MSFDFTHVLVGAALLLAAFVKGATGLGFPLIATPMVALLLDIRTAVTVLILPNLFMDSAQVIRDGIPYDVFRRFSSLILPTIIGVFLGTMALVNTPLWILEFLPRGHGARIRCLEPASIRVHDLAATRKITFADLRFSQRFFERAHQRRRADFGDLSL